MEQVRSMGRLVMSRDKVVAKADSKNRFVWKDEALCPLYFMRTENLDGWLAGRAIDSHRPNSRLLKKALRLAERDDISTVLSVHAVTVTDTYWVKDADSGLTWEDVRFKKDYFSTLALKGDYNSFASAGTSRNAHTQELTNIGSFEKCWRLKDGVWWLYKQADAQELFSEYFISLLGKRLGFDMAEYIPCNDYIRPKTRAIRTRDFTDGAKVNFEPLDAIMGEDVEDYVRTYNVLKQFGQDIASDYVSIVFMDAVCANPDRHSFNLGILRDVDTGKVLRLAPNFDNNMALIARGYPAKRSYGGDMLISDLNALLASGVYWKGYSESRTLPVITEALLRDTIQQTGFKVRTGEIAEYLLSRYQKIHF